MGIAVGGSLGLANEVKEMTSLGGDGAHQEDPVLQLVIKDPVVWHCLVSPCIVWHCLRGDDGIRLS